MPSDKEFFRLFNVNDSVIVVNPTDEDFKFTVGGTREYIVKAGEKRLLHGSAARLYVKRMLDYLFISNNEIKKLHNEPAEAEKALEIVVKVISDDMAVDDQMLDDLSDAVEGADVREQPPAPAATEVADPHNSFGFSDSTGNNYMQNVGDEVTKHTKNGEAITAEEFAAAHKKHTEQTALASEAHANDGASPAKTPKEVAKQEQAFPNAKR